MKKYFFVVFASFLILIFSGVSQSALAYVASSTHYQIEKDSINFGGTDFSSSANYSLSDTFGEVATGSSTDLTKIVQAGYRAADNDYFIAISSAGGVNLSPEINGASGGSSMGSTTWQVTTNDPAGYELYLKSGSNPSLTSGSNYFDDYASVLTGIPDFSWQSVPASARFGFAVEGDDVVQKFKNDGLACDTGSSNTSLICWQGLSTSYQLVSSLASANYPASTDLIATFKAEVGSRKTLNAGSYAAQVTAMAMAL